MKRSSSTTSNEAHVKQPGNNKATTISNAVVIVVVAVLTFALGFLVGRLPHSSPLSSPLIDASTSNSDHRMLFVPRADQNPRGLRDSCELSELYLTLAAEVAAAGDDGHWGWLYLLAAHDLCPTDSHILRNLAQNYEAAGYLDIAIDELETLGASLQLAIREQRSVASAASTSAPAVATCGRLGIVPTGVDEQRR